MTTRAFIAVALASLSACVFAPDLSRYEPCTASGECPAGFLCLAEARRCVPECGEDCPPPDDAGTDDAGVEDAGADAGDHDAGVEDAGPDAGDDDAGVEDAGTDAGPPLALPAQALAAAIETAAYAVDFMPTGGVGQHHFSMEGGVPGFTLSVTGTLSTAAAPTPGTFPFSITVEDDAVPRATVTTPFSLEVRPLLRVASNVLTDGRQGQAYSEVLSATGGTPPYTWSLDGGAPPTGLSLSDAGVLSGTPSTSGAAVTFGVTVSDSASPPQRASRQLSVQIKTLVLTLDIATAGAPDGRVGTAYALPLKVSGGTPPYTWSVQSGTASLPPGLALTNAGSDWALSGTPTATGTFPITVRCVDSVLQSQNQALSLTVY